MDDHDTAGGFVLVYGAPGAAADEIDVLSCCAIETARRESRGIRAGQFSADLVKWSEGQL